MCSQYVTLATSPMFSILWAEIEQNWLKIVLLASFCHGFSELCLSFLCTNGRIIFIFDHFFKFLLVVVDQTCFAMEDIVV